MKRYSLDLDTVKIIFKCRDVVAVQWRVSSSGLGWHFAWTCHKVRCRQCTRTRTKLDDKTRFKLDQVRLRRGIRTEQASQVLFDRKRSGGPVAGPWHLVLRTDLE